VPADASVWGIADGYHDVAGDWHATPPETRDAFLAAMDAERGVPPSPTHWVVRAGDRVDPGGAAELTLEDGTILPGVPPDVPLGYHRLRRLDGSLDVGLVVSPGRCHLPAGLRTWGFAAQLPTVRSAHSWGMGDLADLRAIAEWSRSVGAGMLLVNPLHASRPILPQEPSPYSPSSRRYRNPLYLRLDEVPGWDIGDAELRRLADEARRLTERSVVDRDAIWACKLAALERLWERFRGDDTCEAYCRAEGDSLLGYATFCVLDERRAGGQHDGPLPHPASAEVRRLQEEPETADRIAFHMWVQWLLDGQLHAAGASLDLMQDLAVGFDPDGADAWQYQDVLVPTARVGAPPDEFNLAGQDWGLPPFDPWKLRAAGYEAFVQTVRNGFRHAGGLRVDHVMGLFRQFWVPLGGSPTDGTYVRYPWQDLLRILALESVRAEAYVVGEDLGTVEEEVRRELAAVDVLSYRLFWFEPKPPSDWPERALGAVTTHDLPTVAGIWTASDLDDQRAAGVEPNEDGAGAIRRRIVDETGVAPDAPVDDVVTAVYGKLAEAPSAIVVATLEDVVAAERRPNLPGTTGEQRDNWSIALPTTVESLVDDARAARLAEILGNGRHS
jgi:4-alpha-glucanotransferase